MKETMTWIALKIGDAGVWVATRMYTWVERGYYKLNE